MKRAFTLIELLAVVAIIGIMVTAGVVSVRSGQDSARVRAAARDIFAIIRHARSTALVSMKPSVITYSTVPDENGEQSARLDIHTATIMSEDSVTEAWTLAGEKVAIGDTEPEAAADEGGESQATGAGEGQSVSQILFAPISEEVVRGIAIKVIKDSDDAAAAYGDRKTKISVFSTANYIVSQLERERQSAAEKAKAQETEGAETEAAATAAATEGQEPVSIVWEVNGRTEPHRVIVYAAGKDPDKGLVIRIDRFGAARILGQGEDDD